MSESYTRIVLAERPKEHITTTTFKKETAAYNDLKPGPKTALVKVDWLSLDPAMRGCLNDTRSYLPPVQIGQVMRAVGVGTIVQTGEESSFRIGQVVRGTFGK